MNVENGHCWCWCCICSRRLRYVDSMHSLCSAKCIHFVGCHCLQTMPNALSSNFNVLTEWVSEWMGHARCRCCHCLSMPGYFRININIFGFDQIPYPKWTTSANKHLALNMCRCSAIVVRVSFNVRPCTRDHLLLSMQHREIHTMQCANVCACMLMLMCKCVTLKAPAYSMVVCVWVHVCLASEHIMQLFSHVLIGNDTESDGFVLISHECSVSQYSHWNTM